METTLRSRSSKERVRDALRSLPQGVVGGGVTSETFLYGCGLALLERISAAFIVKSKGGTDEAGERWAPLSPVTLAIRARKSGQRTPPVKAKKGKGKTKYPTDNNVNPATRRVRSIIKGKGKAQRYDKYAVPSTDILVDTGALLDSLTPGSGSPHQIVRVENNTVVVGTTREGAMDQHHGDPKRNLPRRRLWPPSNKWSSGWWQNIINEVRDGIIDMVTERVRNAR